MSGRKKIEAWGIDRAFTRQHPVVLAARLNIAPSTLQRWRRQDPSTALQRMVERAGSQVALALILGVSQKTVSEWVRKDDPPTPQREPQNAVERAVTLAGGQPKLAAALGVSQQNVSLWVKRGYVPAGRAREIEIQYGVPRADLLSPKIKSAAGLGGGL